MLDLGEEIWIVLLALVFGMIISGAEVTSRRQLAVSMRTWRMLGGKRSAC